MLNTTNSNQNNDSAFKFIPTAIPSDRLSLKLAPLLRKRVFLYSILRTDKACSSFPDTRLSVVLQLTYADGDKQI